MIELPPFTMTHERRAGAGGDREQKSWKVSITDIPAHPGLRIELRVEQTTIAKGVYGFELTGVRYRRVRHPEWVDEGSLDAVVVDQALWEQILDAVPHRLMQVEARGDDEVVGSPVFAWTSWKEVRALEPGKWGPPTPSDEEVEGAMDALVGEIEAYLATGPRVPNRSAEEPSSAAAADEPVSGHDGHGFEYFRRLLDTTTWWLGGEHPPTDEAGTDEEGEGW